MKKKHGQMDFWSVVICFVIILAILSIVYVFTRNPSDITIEEKSKQEINEILMAAWDTGFDYNSETNTYTITNATTGEIIARITLLSEKDYAVGLAGEEKLVAWYSLENYYEYNGNDVFGEVETYDLNNDNAPINKNFVYKEKWIDYDDVQVRDWYDEVCQDAGNGSEVCHTEKIGGYEYYIPEWRNFNKNNPIESGNYTIGLFTEVEDDEHIEWISTMYGIRLDEWAGWSAGLNTDLWAYYKFDTSSGLNDSLGNWNATSIFVPVYVSWGAIINEALYFNSSPQVNWVNITENIGATSQTFGENFTINMWVNITDRSTNPKVLDRFEAGGAGKGQFRIQITKASVSFLINAASGSAEVTSTMTQNTTTMITGVYNGTDVSLYINGTFESRTALTGDMKSTRDDIILGIDNILGGNRFHGTVDEFGIWNKTLTASEINDLWNNGNGLAYQGGANPSITTTLAEPTNGKSYVFGYIHFNATVTVVYSNITNATIFVYNSTNDIFNKTTNLLTGNSSGVTSFTNLTSFNISLAEETYKWNVYACAVNLTGETLCDWEDSNYSLTIGLADIVTEYDDTIYELDAARYNITFNSSTTPTIYLHWNGTRLTTTPQDLVGNNWRVEEVIQVGTGRGNKTVFWEVQVGTFNYNTTKIYQSLNNTNFSICGGDGGIHAFLNLTFKNETVSKEDISASVPSSTFYYWLGDGTYNKTLSFVRATLNNSYGFCAIPSHRTLNIEYSIAYTNPTSQQRTFSETTTLTNSTTNVTLYLLPTSKGIFTTFLIVNIADQPLSGVVLNLTRASYGTISKVVTGGTGSATFFLDPDATYTICANHVSYSPKCLTQQFQDTTIILGSSTITTTEDFTQGIDWSLSPQDILLYNQTTYEFNFSLTSTYWTVNSFGFVLTNSTGAVINSTSSAANGGIVRVYHNVGNDSEIFMNAYWNINGNYTNVTSSWIVILSSDTSFSIWQFITDFDSYLAVGMFGLDNFGLGLIIFVTIFLFAGILSFRFGINSSIIIVGVITAFVAFFDVGIGIIPNPIGAIAHFPTWIMVLITFAIVVREGTR